MGFKIIQISGVLFLVTLAALIAALIMWSLVEYASNEQKQWSVNRVANYYGDCLDAKHGMQPSLFNSGRRDMSELRSQLYRGQISRATVNDWLVEAGCTDLPAEAME